MQCQGPGCTKHVQQKEGGHRARKYCSDACRVAAHRAAARAEEAERANDDALRATSAKKDEAARERQEIRNRYADLSEALIDLLLHAKQQYGLHSVSVIGAALVREQETSGEERTRYAGLQDVNRQNSKRIAHLEMELQRYQRLEILKSRDSMLAELMVLGGRLQYAALTDLGIKEGIDEWRNYVRGASDADLAAAIAHGFYQADRLALAAIEASDLQRERQMHTRLDELERLVALQAGRIDELEHGAGENGEEADILSQEQVRALRYHARERALLIEQQARQIEELEDTIRARIEEIHRLEDAHGRTMYQMNLLLAEAQSAAQRPAEEKPANLILDNEQQRAALAQLLLISSKEQRYPELRLSGYLRLFPGCLTENDLPDIVEGRSAWQRVMAKLGIPALLIALTSMQARRALEEQRSIASEHAWREHLSLEEARKEASDFATKYYRLKEQVETTSASTTTGEKPADAEKNRDKQELEHLRTLIAKQEQALAVRSETVLKRGVTIRTLEKTIEEMKNQLTKVTDQLEHAHLVITAREADIQELVRAPHIDCAVENSALKQSLKFLQAAVRKAREGTLKMEHAAALEEIERLKHPPESQDAPAEKEPPPSRKQQAAIERAKEEIRILYQVSVQAAEEERDTALRQVAELSQQLEQAQRGAEEVSGQEKPLEWMSEPAHIVLRAWRSRPGLTEEQLEWIKWQAIKDTSAHYHTEAEGEYYRQALQAYFEYANVPAETAEAHIPPSLKAVSVGTPVREEA